MGKCSFLAIIFVSVNLFVSRAGRAYGNMSDCRYLSDCRFRGQDFDPGQLPYFRGDWSWNNFYSHSPPFHWLKTVYHLFFVSFVSLAFGLFIAALWSPAGKGLTSWLLLVMLIVFLLLANVVSWVRFPDLCRLFYFVLSYKGKYVHKVQLNGLVKVTQEKSLIRWTDHPDMTIAADWDVKIQTKTKCICSSIVCL